MIERKLTVRDIDDFFSVFRKGGSAIANIRLVEPAIQLIEYCRTDIGIDSYEHYSALFWLTHRTTFSADMLRLLNHDTLIVLDKMATSTIPNPARDLMPRTLAEQTRRRVVLGYLCLGNADAAADRSRGPSEIEEISREIAAIRDAIHSDRVMLAMAFEGRSGSGITRLGKTIEARCELIKTSEGDLWRDLDPDVVFEGHIRDEGADFGDQLKCAVSVAERIFAEKYGVKRIRKLPRRYLFGSEDARKIPGLIDYFVGESAGLGFALLAMASLDSLHARPRQRFLRGDCAFTGRIDDQGHVLSVSEECLGHKIRAVFFSPCRTLALPERNMAAAVRMMERLRSEYPGRILNLVAVGNVFDAFEDDRLSEERTVARSTILLDRLRRRVKYGVAVGSLVVAAAVSLALLPSHFDHHTARAIFENGALSFYNSHGHRFATFTPDYPMFNVEKRTFGQEIEAIDPAVRDTSYSRDHILYLRDVNGDGSKETVFLGLEAKQEAAVAAGRVHVHLFSNKGDERWHLPLWDSLAVVSRGTTYPFGEFDLYRTELTDANGDGFTELFVLSRHRSEGLAAVIQVDLSDRTYQTFAHFGYLSEFMIVDFEGDGKKELIVTGLGGAPISGSVFMVLDPGAMQGSSPRRSNLTFRDYPRDVALEYIWLPTSSYCRVHGECDRPEARAITHESSGPMMKIGSLEFNHALLFCFNRSWECIAVEPTSYFASSYRKMASDHPEMDPLETELVKLRQSVQYWHGDHWEGRPAHASR